MWARHFQKLNVQLLRNCNPKKDAGSHHFSISSIVCVVPSKLKTVNPHLSVDVGQLLQLIGSFPKMEVNTEETSAWAHVSSTIDKSPRDGPSDRLDGLGTLAYHM